jgi:hypothetical protein
MFGRQRAKNGDDALPSAGRNAGWGLLSCRARWGLSWRGRLVGLLLLVVAGITGLFTIHPFLSPSRRENTDILVVEGWVNLHIMRAAAEEIKTGAYRRVFTTGGPVEGMGGYVNDYNTAASVGAGLLRKVGVPDDILQMVPSHISGRDRTYSSAVALKNWFHEHNVSVHAINVLTEGPHARRTRLLFQEAFGKDVKVGIISVASPDYDSKHWWRYSEGVRQVVGETIAYIYAKLLFSPSKNQDTIEIKSPPVSQQLKPHGLQTDSREKWVESPEFFASVLRRRVITSEGVSRFFGKQISTLNNLLA